jgi:GNAT superfamily N-acetyltransferase
LTVADIPEDIHAALDRRAERRGQSLRQYLAGELRRQGSALAGFACYAYLWPAIKSTKSLYLKELFVGDRYRNAGIGGLLMAELVSIARDNNCSRLEWATDSGNTGARP